MLARAARGSRIPPPLRLLSTTVPGPTLTTSDLTSRLDDTPSGPLALLISPRRCNLSLLPLASQLRGGSVLLSTSPSDKRGGDGGKVYERIRGEMRGMGVEVVELGDCDGREQVMRRSAYWCIERGVKTLVVGDTRCDAGRLSLSRYGEVMKEKGDAGEVRGLEVLPRGVLEVRRPLVGVGGDVVDRTVDAMGFEGLEGVLEGEKEVSKEQLLGCGVDEAVEYGRECKGMLEELDREAGKLLVDCVVDVNHWGYVVFRRSVLQDALHDRDRTYVALTALRNMLMHVSGSERIMACHEQELVRFAYSVLGHHRFDHVVPPGRTLAGALIRPAGSQMSRRFEKLRSRDWRRDQRGQRSVVQSDRSTAYSYGQMLDSEKTEYLILSREPDSESKGLRGKRLGGNVAASTLDGCGQAVYWDNRYVICGAKVETLDRRSSPVPEKTVLLASLRERQETSTEEWEKSSFYVRQLRKVDWEIILSVSRRVRMYRVPFQCIRGLPIIFEKDSESMSVGKLAASPHLGLSSRPDMFFTAVRVPRYRCLPDELEPGFRIAEKYTDRDQNEARRA